jgi:hypothetical protein
MKLEKAFVHEIHEKTRNSVSRQPTQWVLTNNLGRDIGQWTITRKNSNRYHNFDLHLTDWLPRKSKLLIYFVPFVLFVDKKRFVS